MDNLSFSRCAVPLHVMVVIFKKKVLILQLKFKYENKRATLYWSIQEDLIEFLVQISLLYMPLVHNLCALYI